MKISPARIAAFDVLIRIEKDKAFSSALLPAYEADLSPVDRSLCHELVLGVLRRQIYLDRVIDTISKGKKLDVPVRIAIRLGLYQLLFLDRIPDHSAVNDSVNLVLRARKTSAKGFVNAILRSAAREKVPITFMDEVDRLSVETSHPRWLIERWIDEFGLDNAGQIAAANNKVPSYAFRSLSSSPVQINGAKSSEFVEGCYLIDHVDGDPLAFAEAHGIYFQDEGSQMVAAAVHVPQGGRFMDLCAAPGGKTGYIATHSTVGMLVAGDLHRQRVDMLRDNNRGQDANIQIVQYDAERPLPFQEAAFDAVLVDAPCSGTGTIRHNPEIRYFLRPSDITELAGKQLAILRNASKLVTRGGALVYSTCSLEIEENEMVCAAFLNEASQFSQVPPKVDGRFLTKEGFARTFPHRDGMDGFFIAEFRSQ